MRFLQKILKPLSWSALIAAVAYGLLGRRFYEAWREWRAFRTQREHLERRVNRYRLQVAKKRYFVRKLMTDADFREHMLHEQVDYVGENEYVIYFLGNEHISDREENEKRNVFKEGLH